jgi:hypothetical protein
MRRLIEARLSESDREALDRAGLALTCCHSEHAAGIQAPRQKDAQGNVADQPAADRLLDQVLQLFDEAWLVLVAKRFLGLD